MKPVDNNRLNRLIDKYFEGATSLREETRLRRLLADSRFQGENVDAARAVMGVFAVARQIDGQARSLGIGVSRHRRLSPIASAAASIALLFVASVALTGRAGASDLSKAFAKVGSTTINDPEAISSMMMADLASINEASETIESSIADELSIFEDL